RSILLLLAAAHLYMNNHNKHWDIPLDKACHPSILMQGDMFNVAEKIIKVNKNLEFSKHTYALMINSKAKYLYVYRICIMPEVKIFLQETSGIIEAYHHAHATWTGRVLIRFVESGLILFQTRPQGVSAFESLQCFTLYTNTTSVLAAKEEKHTRQRTVKTIFEIEQTQDAITGLKDILEHTGLD
ncbi:hypothetical protein ACJX0J_010639, partial [Zea mays]